MFYWWLFRRFGKLLHRHLVQFVTDERIPIGGTPGFATLNIRTGQTFGTKRQHRKSLSLENITDKAYLVDGSGVLGTGATLRFGYSWLF